MDVLMWGWSEEPRRIVYSWKKKLQEVVHRGTFGSIQSHSSFSLYFFSPHRATCMFTCAAYWAWYWVLIRQRRQWWAYLCLWELFQRLWVTRQHVVSGPLLSVTHLLLPRQERERMRNTCRHSRPRHAAPVKVFSALRLHWTLCAPTLMHLTCREESRWRSERDLRIQSWVTLNDNSEVNGCQLKSSEFSRGDFTVCVNCVFKWFHSSLCPPKKWGLCAASVFHLSAVIKGLYFWNHNKKNKIQFRSLRS